MNNVCIDLRKGSAMYEEVKNSLGIIYKQDLDAFMFFSRAVGKQIKFDFMLNEIKLVIYVESIELKEGDIYLMAREAYPIPYYYEKDKAIVLLSQLKEWKTNYKDLYKLT